MAEQPCTLVDLCSSLINTYNASILNEAPPVLQQSCLNEAIKCVEQTPTHNGKHRNVLMQLINNQYTKKRPEVNYIGGPISLTCHWSKEYQKLIYIFGEAHSTQTDCPFESNQMLIEEYLYQFVMNTNALVDIIFEVDAFTGPEYKIPLSQSKFKDFRMYRIGTTFEQCIHPPPTLPEQCNLSRIHYFDVRRNETIGVDPISAFIFEYDDIIKMPFQYEEHLVEALVTFAIAKINILNSFLIEPRDTDNFKKFWISQLYLNKHVVKELDRIDHPISGIIKNFIETQILLEATEYHELLRSNTIEILKRIKKYEDLKKYPDRASIFNFPLTAEDDLNFLTSFEEVSNSCISINLRFPDAYTLARIFKKFKIDTTIEQKKRHTDEPVEPHNIIIYAGHDHSQIYRKFLEEEVGFERIAKIGSYEYSPELRPQNCINMFEFKEMQPLFSGWPPPKMPNMTNDKKKKRSMCNIMICKQNYTSKRLPRKDTYGMYGGVGAEDRIRSTDNKRYDPKKRVNKRH
jgi:hypothetical protein